MKNVFSRKTLSVALVAGITLFYSCSKTSENALSSNDSQNVNSESVSASTATETADMTATVVNNSNDTQLSGARVAVTPVDWKTLDGRLKGATITITPGGTFDVPQGTITIDFGTGTTDAYGIVRKGTITIDYYGRRYKTGSYRTIHYTGYSRTVSATNSNTITFDDAMVYTVTNVTDTTTTAPIQMRHVLENGKLTFSSDNSFILRNSNVVVAWDKNAGTLTHLAKTADITHSATGTNRKGVNYTMDITKDLVHKISCLPDVHIPVSGTKNFTVGNNVTVDYSIDYGNGACDNTVVITIGTKSITTTVNADGN